MKRDIPFMLNHLGLFIALTTATLGSADIQRVKMICGVGEPEWRAMEQGGAIKEMPIAIELKKFIMETYEDGKPKRYASEIQILTKSGKNIETTIDVNKPYEVDGWKIYQYGYDTQMGAQSQITILELVSDQWLPWVCAGFYMMLAGVVVMTLIVLWRRLRKVTGKALWIYWSWDPKETWAAITWIAYLVYIHYRQLPQQRNRLAFWMLIGSFVLLQMCWWGINYLPSAQGSSVHTYSTSE
jgi:cytochrome c biogenesis protein ResB